MVKEGISEEVIFELIHEESEKQSFIYLMNTGQGLANVQGLGRACSASIGYFSCDRRAEDLLT